MAVDYEKEGKIAIFTINRPEALNAISPQVLQELHDTMVDFRDDPNLWVGIITGAGERAFSAGADIKEMRPGEARKDPPTPMRGLEIWKPLIAAINGFALGGGLETALACDIRIASENARLGLPEVTRGPIPGWGGTQRLPRIIPWSYAAEMIFTGKIIDAQEAYRIGLVNKVVPLEQLMPAAKEMAELICQAAPLAVRATKEAMIRGCSMSLEQGLGLERVLSNLNRKAEDFKEGTTAFKEKRKPAYQGK